MIKSRSIQELLLKVGVPVNIMGYRYLDKAIDLMMGNDSYMNSKMMILYDHIAEEYGVKAGNVEHCIRTAIESAFDNGNTDLLYQLFGNTIKAHKAKPTNAQFIITLAQYLKHMSDT